MSAVGEGFISGRLARALRGAAAADAPRAGAAKPRATAASGRRLPRPGWRGLLAATCAISLLVAGWFWLRDSSLVAIETVEISGVPAAPGTQGARVRAALDQAARSMTTLHVRHDALDTAVSSFSLVKRLEVSTDFPNTIRIHVVTNVAVGAVVIGGRRIAVTSDGTLMRDMRAAARLPEIQLAAEPTGNRLTAPEARAAVAALSVAPSALRRRVEGIVTTPERGLEIQLAHGPLLRFGPGERMTAKWAAAAAVLADAESAGASVIDVSAPERPAVSGLPQWAVTGDEESHPYAGAAAEANPGVEGEGAGNAPSTLDPE